jgi:hypothetical protein
MIARLHVHVDPDVLLCSKAEPMAQSVARGWEYIDPKGNIQGPFPASDILKWADQGFFSGDSKVAISFH